MASLRSSVSVAAAEETTRLPTTADCGFFPPIPVMAQMGGIPRTTLGPGQGGQKPLNDHQISIQTQDKVISKSYANVAATNVFDYDKITEKSKENRNTLVAKITNLPKHTGEQSGSPLSMTDWADFLFDEMNMDPADALGIDFFSGNRGSVEVLLNPNVDVGKFICSGRIFKGFNMEVSKMASDETKVVFLNVPLFVPDEEIIHLVKSYGGKLEKEEVQYEMKEFSTTGGKKVSLRTTTRFVYATFPANKYLRRFYWLEGPCRNDPGRRIIVQHKGQKERQCGNCLRFASECPYSSRTHLCRDNAEDIRKPLGQYMEEVRKADGYQSLKAKYIHDMDVEEAEVLDIHNDRHVYNFEKVGDEEVKEGEGYKAKALKDGAAGANGVRPGPASMTVPPFQENKTMSKRAEKKEIGKLEKELSEKAKEFEALRELQLKSEAEVAQLKQDNIFKTNSIAAIKENFKNDLGWKTTGAFTSTTAANLLVEKFFFNKEKNKVEVKEGSTWDDLLKTIGLDDIDKDSKQFAELQNLIETILKNRLSGPDKATPQRSASVTRNRSDSDLETLEQEAKKAKADVKSPVKEEEAKPKASPKTSPPGKSKKTKNKNGGF